MSRAKHTPGPWEWDPIKDHPVNGFIWARKGPRSKLVTRLGGVKRPDARLIAAAPDMLAMLISLYKYARMGAIPGAITRAATEATIKRAGAKVPRTNLYSGDDIEGINGDLLAALEKIAGYQHNPRYNGWAELGILQDIAREAIKKARGA